MGSSWSSSPTPADIWAAGARTLTEFSAEEIFDLPIIDSRTPSGGTGPTSSAAADAWGSWVELVADVGASKRLIGTTIRSDHSIGYHFEIELGEGVSGSEAAIARIPTVKSGLHIHEYYQIWKALGDNIRLSARARDSSSLGRVFHVVPQIA